jgi:type IV pilus secretin PilQ/predicted competence protein
MRRIDVTALMALAICLQMVSCSAERSEKTLFRAIPAPSAHAEPERRGPIPPEFTLSRPVEENEAALHHSAGKPQSKKTVINIKDIMGQQASPPLLSMNLGGSTLETVMRLIEDVSGSKIIVDPEIYGFKPAPIRLSDVTWFAALELIVKTNALMASVRGDEMFPDDQDIRQSAGRGDIITISTREKFLSTQEARLKAADMSLNLAERKRKTSEERVAAQASGMGPMIAKSYKFRYADPAEALDYLEKLYVDYDKETLKTSAAQGSIQYAADQSGSSGPSHQTAQLGHSKDASSLTRVKKGDREEIRFAIYKPENLITITAPARKMDEIMERVKEIDARPRQVHIEARIVEIQRSKVKDLGIQWGGWGARTTDMAFPNTAGVYGASAGSSGGYGNAVSLPSQSSIDAATGQASTAAQGLAVGVIMGDVTGSLAVSARLLALETAGVSRTLSNPKIVAVNGAKAVIKSGREIPYQASSANAGPSVLFKEAVISLTVTPLIMEDNRIRLKIDARKDEVDSTLSVQGTPTIKKKEIVTTVIVDNGGSAALGGMVEGEDSNQQNRVPGLHDIPWLGWLFKSDRKVDSQMELLVFITPTLLE